jgi:protein-tyrosine phosphatase
VPDLPPARRPGRYAIEVVCSGNICRSPSAAVVLAARVDDRADELAPGAVRVTSSGIGDWHAGSPMDRRSAAALSAAGYDPTEHRARQVVTADLATYDVVLAMDGTHLRDLLDLGAEPGRTMLFGDFDPLDPGTDVPDPYYGGPDGFEEVLQMVERTSTVLVDRVAARVAQDDARGPDGS